MNVYTMTIFYQILYTLYYYYSFDILYYEHFTIFWLLFYLYTILYTMIILFTTYYIIWNHIMWPFFTTDYIIFSQHPILWPVSFSWRTILYYGQHILYYDYFFYKKSIPWPFSPDTTLTIFHETLYYCITIFYHIQYYSIAWPFFHHIL